MTNKEKPKIPLDPEQLKKLEELAREKGISIDQYCRSDQRQPLQ
jgi:hypothetical protein